MGALRRVMGGADGAWVAPVIDGEKTLMVGCRLRLGWIMRLENPTYT